MSARRPPWGILARWLGWALFWYGVYHAGVEVQTWVFSKDAGPKPAAADLIEPLHFWAPAVFFFLPVWSAQRVFDSLAPPASVWAMRAAIAAWAITVAGLIAWVEDRLRPDRTHRIGTYALVGATGILIGLRLLALLPLGEAAEYHIGAVSYLLLGGLVLATWIALVVGLATIGVRRMWRRDQD